jgi:hypothetical protein
MLATSRHRSVNFNMQVTKLLQYVAKNKSLMYFLNDFNGNEIVAYYSNLCQNCKH